MPGMMARDFEEYLRKLERDIKSAQRAPIGLVNGAVEVLRAERTALSTRRPAAPIELTYQTASYFAGAGYPAVRFLMDFPDVVNATDGDPITIDHYELWGREITPGLLGITTSAAPGTAAPGLTFPGSASTPAQKAAEAALEDTLWTLFGTSPTSSFRVEDFIPATQYEFKARAIGLNTSTPGLYSATVTVTMQKDTTPPPQPTAPVVLSDRGVLRVTHDGQAVSGAMPADLSYLILAQGNGAQPTTEVARFGRSGGIYVAVGLEYYDMQYFRVKAVDESGNEGPWSAAGSGFTEPLVDKDIILSTLDGAETLIKNIDGGVSIKDGTVATKHLLVTEDMTAKLAQFLQVKAVHIDANELWADKAFFGVADSYLVRSDMFIGKYFEGGTFTLTKGGKFQTNPEDLKGVTVQETGIVAYNSTSGQLTFSLDANTGNMVATGAFQTSLSGTRAILWDHGDGIAALDLYPDTGVQHGAIYTVPVVGQGNYVTSVRHHLTESSYSTHLSMWADGSWTLGSNYNGTPGGYIGWTKSDGNMILSAAQGTQNRLQMFAGWYAQIASVGMFLQGTTGNVDLSSSSGIVLATSGAAPSGISLTATGSPVGIQLTSSGSSSYGVLINASNSISGIQLNAGTSPIWMQGKLPNAIGNTANQSIYMWKVGASQATNIIWDVTYPAPVPSGVRYPICTVDAANPAKFCVQNNSASGFKALAEVLANSNTTFKFIAPWTE
jgi:hypothetical protein